MDVDDGQEREGPVRFHVRLQFAEDGPQVTGTWEQPGTAEGKFSEFVGSHDLPGVWIRLVAEHADGSERVLKTWKGGAGLVAEGP